jgi:thioredoxin reductase (NADPH)
MSPGDMRTMRGHDAFVVGGGNSAGQAAVHLARWARHVTLLVRGHRLDKGMSDYLVRQIEHLPNIDVRLDTEVVDGRGEGALREITIMDRLARTKEVVPAESLFVLIGAQPNTEWLEGVVARDRHGFVLTGPDLEQSIEMHRSPSRFETSMPGVFAAGDVRFGSIKRVASAVGEGAVALEFIREYLDSTIDDSAATSDERAG